MTISLRLDEADTAVIKKFADMKKMSVSELIRQTIFERIEDEYDLTAYKKAMAEYRRDPVTYTLDEVEAALGRR